MKLNRKNKKAFTIVELVIVIGVIGILSAILIPTFANLTNKANDARAKEEVAGAYSLYVQDAMDNVLNNDDGDDNTNYNVSKAFNQGEVAIERGGVYFTYDTNGWTVQESYTPGDKVNADGMKYNGCVIYLKTGQTVPTGYHS